WAQLQSELDRIYDDFMSKVATGRHMGKDKVHAAAKGQVWTGVDAKALGLVDELGGLETATTAVKRLANINPGQEVDLVQYPPPPTDLKAALSDLAGGKGEAGAIALLSRLSALATPLAAALRFIDAEDQTLRAPLP